MRRLEMTLGQFPNGVILMTVKGFLDTDTYEDLEKQINQLYAAKRFRVIADLAELRYISSAGIGVFIAAFSEAQENQGKLVILNANDKVKQVFELLELGEIFTFTTSREEALKAFG
ncbi:MAG: STAS domain-containing protein [Planctomycetes bacterium]|nr:STAS domain-containing protein [Planctomycetota bacterium]